MTQLFETGARILSHGAIALFGSREAAFAVHVELCERHAGGDFGVVTADQSAANHLALGSEGEVLSRYEIDLGDGSSHQLCLTTTAGHASTRLHLPSEELMSD
ncbi:TPA: hypothetical protein ACRMWJ_005966 [Pseudomonas aeruginosa]